MAPFQLNYLAQQMSQPLIELKFVNPNVKNLQKSEDGLFRTINGAAVPRDLNVKVISGLLKEVMSIQLIL